MIRTFRNEKMIYRLITLAVLAAAVFFACRMIYAGIIALPYPKEILEPSNIVLTNEFLAGRSPYTMAALEREVPGINYDYPFLNSLIAAAVAKIFGCTAVHAHFAISLVSILGSGAIGYILIVKALKTEGSGAEGSLYTTIAPVFAALLFMFCHWRFGYISAPPDDLGLFEMLLTSYAAVNSKIRNKPFICAIGVTLCFYTKQYFVFVAAGIFIYMLIYSYRDAIMFFIWSLFINTIVVVIITIFWPLYWTKAFLFTYLGTAVGGGGLITTLTDQLVYLAGVFAPLFLVIIVAAVRSVKSLYANNKKLNSIRFNENDVLHMSVIQTIVMMIPLYFIGRNDGAFLSYFLQLWIPFVIVVALVCLERMKPARYEYVYAGIYAAIAVFTIYFGFGKLPLHILNEEEIENWNKASEYTKKYSDVGDVYYARELAYDWIESESGECICGHDGEVAEDMVDYITVTGVPGEYLADMRHIISQNASYRTKILDKAADRRYSLIMIDKSGAYTPFDEGTCRKDGYECIDKLELQLGNMPYEVLFYVPR